MIILKIKQPGLFIRLTGLPPIRTPAEINITKCDLNVILSELRTYDIDNFEIIKSPKQETKQSAQKPTINNIKIKEDNNINIQDNKKINDMIERFDNIEKLLSKILDQKEIANERPYNSDQKVSNKKKETKTEEMFIPSVSSDGLKTSGNFFKESLSKEKDDLEESAKFLSSIYKK